MDTDPEEYSDDTQALPTVTNAGGLTAPGAPVELTSQAIQIEGYELLELIGKGGFGRVYRARQTQLNRVVAIKVLSPSFAADPDFRRRFVQEGQALALLDHPNIVRVIEIGQTDQSIWMVMEFVEGESLHQRLRRGMEIDEIREVLAQVCSGLDEAHANHIVHRDIKPSNILIGSDGRVRVVDFGLAKLDESSLLTGAGHGMGTPGYIAPEQYRDAGSVDWRADIFSLGAMSYQLLTKQIPTAGAPAPSSLNPAVPAAVDKVVFGAMQMEPASRPQGASEFLEQFSNAFNARSRPRFGWWALAGLLLVSGVGVAFAVFSPSDPSLADEREAGLNQGLVLHYDFEEVLEEGVVSDLSGHGHHGDAMGNASFEVDLQGGRSLRINDAQSFVQASHETLDSTMWDGSAFSVWVKVDSYTTYSTVLFRGVESGPGTVMHFQLGAGGRGNQWGGLFGPDWIYPDLLATNAPPLAIDTWHHFAATWDEGGVQFYVNGVKDTAVSETMENWKDSPDHVFCIGRCRGGRDRWPDSYLNGWIDNVRLYNRPLTEKEVRILHLNPAG